MRQLLRKPTEQPAFAAVAAAVEGGAPRVFSSGSLRQLPPLWHKSCANVRQKQFNRNK
jgi:hypothetical protein